MPSVYNDDWICRVHGRPGSHPDEQNCSPSLFAPAAEVKGAAVVDAPPAAPTAEKDGKRYRKRPEPPEVKAVAFGSLMMVNSGNGPEYPVPRDVFFAQYEEVEAEHDPRHVEGPLDRVTGDVDHAIDEVGVDESEVQK